MEFTLKYRGRTIIRAIAPFISIDKQILDIGCGNGVVSDQIQKHFRCDLVGTDIQSYLKKNIKFRHMSKKDALDFKDKEFYLGLFIDVLHHIPFEIQSKLIKDALRVCSEVIIIEVKPTLTAKAIDYLINQIHNPEMPILLTHRTKRNWIKLFKANNISFKSYKVKKPIFFYPVSNYLFHIKSK
ncbi:MAG: class I SAM-dependent methyltransferase [Nanoarchaeota archaeon]|nr:class I SAM-dependent methyltransferase [Nanoarchaeota archaeon]